ncbi:MAG: endonuclease/exonuclease/phosphatase (EEP) superfamily protein YafD [Planctomycetota bacterium]|jgi:endonuclease/exonuclease/phosphatase (EEP) superfamily protein YafD
MSDLPVDKPSIARAYKQRLNAIRAQDHHALTSAGDPSFDPEQGIRMLCWNLAKRPGARAELEGHLGENDLICVQEIKPSMLPESHGSAHFARSFRHLGRESEFNGVATLSRAEAHEPSITAIPSRWKEGWLVTPKMALATEYAMGDQTLLVVNVHALNFQPIFKYMLKDQMQRIAERILLHKGPAIVCGDFNTWRQDRLQLVHNLLHDFTAIPFQNSEHRKTPHWAASLFMGDRDMPLDHIFIRDLEFRDPRVLSSTHSDHGPLSVHLFPKPQSLGDA